MGQILDSSVLIAAERGRFDLQEFFLSRPNELFFLSAVTWSELLHGMERATNAAIKLKRRRFLEDISSNTGLLPFGRFEAEHHARIWVAMESAGTPIGPYDLLIAATALRHDFTSATLNRSEFARVRDLKLADIDPFTTRT